MGNISKFSQLFILCCLPLFMVAGPFIAELSLLIFLIIFFFNIIKFKDFKFFKKNILYFISLFYIFLIISGVNSNYFNENYINILFYLRFILISLAISYFLINNQHYLKYIFYFFSFLLFIIYIDSITQFYFEKNILGFPKYRPDRISSFFNDDLILGSFLLRVTPLLIWFGFYFEKDKLKTRLVLILSMFHIYIIFLSGERASFLLVLIYFILLFFALNLNFIFKLKFILFSISIICLTFFLNPILFDRYGNQLYSQIFASDKNNVKFFPYYLPMFDTSLKMMKDSPILGQGPKSFRYACNEKKFEVFFDNRDIIIDNTIVKFQHTWKEPGNLTIENFYVEVGDNVKKNDLLLSYKFINKKEIIHLKAQYEFQIKKIIKKNTYLNDDRVIEVWPKNLPEKIIKKKNSCNTHPHNYYMQLLGETGLVGFIFVLSIFIYILIKIISNSLCVILKKNIKLSNLQICLLTGFIISLWPFTTTGNFFNNWINIMNYYPLGFYLFTIEKIKKDNVS